MGRHRRRAILISVIGAKAYNTLSDLFSPVDLRQLKRTWRGTEDILKSHFAPKKLVIVERFRFHNCKQASRTRECIRIRAQPQATGYHL